MKKKGWHAYEGHIIELSFCTADEGTQCSLHLLQTTIMQIPFLVFGFGKVATRSAVKIFLVLAYVSYLRAFRGVSVNCSQKGQLLLFWL